MPVSIVVGGQYGSEGKGKVAHYLAREMSARFAVRCGGPNSGHTVIDEQGNARIFQQLPTAAILPDVNAGPMFLNFSPFSVSDVKREDSSLSTSLFLFFFCAEAIPPIRNNRRKIPNRRFIVRF